MKLLSQVRHALFTLLGVFCLGGVAAAQNTSTPAPAAPAAVVAPRLQPSAREVGERLVDAIIQVESQGDPQRVGRAGERGLMQIRLTTWRETTRGIFGRPQPFQRAFDPALNRRVGRAYLLRLQTQIAQHRTEWRADARALLIAAYNAGPTLLVQKNFDLKKMPASTRDYVERVINLHDAYLASRTAQLHQQLATQVAAM